MGIRLFVSSITGLCLAFLVGWAVLSRLVGVVAGVIAMRLTFVLIGPGQPVAERAGMVDRERSGDGYDISRMV